MKLLAGEVLSQSEIDALLAAISTGEMDAEELKEELQKEEKEKKVKNYDFKRALRFSKDQIRGLTRIHENFARLVTTHLSAQLRSVIQMTVASVDQIPYEEFIRSVPSMTILNVYEMSPLEGRILVEVSPNIAYAMLDRVLGGTGFSMNKVENLTEIETNIMSRIFEKVFETLSEAWESLVEVEVTLVEFEINPQFLQIISPNETVVVITFNLQMGNTSGMLNICLPHTVLKPLIPQLSIGYWMNESENRKSSFETEYLEKKVRRTQLPLIALMGETEITIQDFLQLDVGDVIQLNQEIADPLVLQVNDKAMYHVQPGVLNKKLSVQVIDSIEGGEHEDE